LMPITIFMTRCYHSSNLQGRFTSVSQNFFSIFLLTFLSMSVFLVSSCEENPTQIGNDLLPGSDFVTIKSTDTLRVYSYTMYDKSFRTDNASVSYLGQIYDPYFGTTNAEFVTQIRMAGAWDDLPFVMDSVKLILHLLEVKGGSGVTHSLKLTEIATQLYTDSAYYSDRLVDTTTFGVTVDLPALKADTINDIIVTLPKAFGIHLTRDTAKLFYSNTKPDFRSFFKGLYFRITPSSNPLLVSVSLQPPAQLGAYTNFIVFYMSNTDGVKKEFYFVLDAINRNASFNRFSHDFSTATLGNKMVNRNTTYKDSLSYLQSLNGVFTKISIPGLETLKNDPKFDNIGVNRARLSVPVYLDGSLYKASTIPSQLVLRYKSKDGNKYIVPDYNIDQYHSFFDGNMDTTANLYRFNIANFIQGYLEDASGNMKPELELFQGAGTKNVILRANKNKTPVKFEFTYTKF
jgi:hypothetical protein